MAIRIIKRAENDNYISELIEELEKWFNRVEFDEDNNIINCFVNKNDEEIKMFSIAVIANTNFFTFYFCDDSEFTVINNLRPGTSELFIVSDVFCSENGIMFSVQNNLFTNITAVPMVAITRDNFNNTVVLMPILGDDMLAKNLQVSGKSGRISYLPLNKNSVGRANILGVATGATSSGWGYYSSVFNRTITPMVTLSQMPVFELGAYCPNLFNIITTEDSITGYSVRKIIIDNKIYLTNTFIAIYDSEVSNNE